jgi:hypothetical protein
MRRILLLLPAFAFIGLPFASADTALDFAAGSGAKAAINHGFGGMIPVPEIPYYPIIAIAGFVAFAVLRHRLAKRAGARID